MPIQLAQQGKVRILEQKVAAWEGIPIKVRLYQNNYTPAPGGGFTLATFVQATFDGYADQDLDAWGVPALVGSAGYVEHAVVTWTPTGTTTPNTIYGYVVYDPTDNTVLWAERHPAGGITVGGDLVPYSVMPTMLEETF